MPRRSEQHPLRFRSHPNDKEIKNPAAVVSSEPGYLLTVNEYTSIYQAPPNLTP